VSSLAQDVLRRRHQSQNNIYKGNLHKIKTGEEITLAYSQNGKQTKPPPMVIEGKRNKFRLQPRKSKRFNIFYHLSNRANFIIKLYVISFLPDFPHRSEPDDLNNRAAHLGDTTTESELIKMVQKNKVAHKTEQPLIHQCTYK